MPVLHITENRGKKKKKKMEPVKGKRYEIRGMHLQRLIK